MWFLADAHAIIPWAILMSPFLGYIYIYISISIYLYLYIIYIYIYMKQEYEKQYNYPNFIVRELETEYWNQGNLF